MRRSFTLIELIIVMSLFGVLAVVGTGFVVQVIQSSNRVNISNEVRQNAQSVMSNLILDLRKSSNVTLTNPTGSTVTIAITRLDTVLVTYNQTSTGMITRQEGSSGNVLTLTSPDVAFCKVAAGSCVAGACATPGLSLKCGGATFTNGCTSSIDVTLYAQQNLTSSRSDFCAQTTLNDSVSPRLRP